MALSSGSRLGPYEILSSLGAGGMGEVYRARDSRLGRQVALKILPESLAADAGRLARFEQDHKRARELYEESLKIFRDLDHKRGIARVLECFACSAAARRQPETALRLAGAAAVLRREIGAPPLRGEQDRLERMLVPARRSVTDSRGAALWMEGWATPLDRAIEEVLASGSA